VQIIAIIRLLLAKNKILQLFDWLTFFEGNCHCNTSSQCYADDFCGGVTNVNGAGI
jgi:hypothetical protein